MGANELAFGFSLVGKLCKEISVLLERIGVLIQANGRKRYVSGRKPLLNGRRHSLVGRKLTFSGRKPISKFDGIALITLYFLIFRKVPDTSRFVGRFLSTYIGVWHFFLPFDFLLFQTYKQNPVYYLFKPYTNSNTD